MAILKGKFFRPGGGAVLAVLAGLLLGLTPIGAPWVNASYDYLFLFSNHPVTNQVVLIQMDNDAYNFYGQVRGEIWERGLHAQLLNRLADDGCALVIMDMLLRSPRNPETDAALAQAMKRLPVVLMAKQAELTDERTEAQIASLDGVSPVIPAEPFLSASGTNFGVAWLSPDFDSIVRKHWPFGVAEPVYPSLPLAAARLAGARLQHLPEERWLRYYSPKGAWERLSYRLALSGERPTGYFRDKIVFIGAQPENTVPDRSENDKYLTPRVRWSGEASGGVDIMITTFLNLMNRDWLLRTPANIEALMLVATGLVLGLGLSFLRPFMAVVLGSTSALLAGLAAICLGHFSQYWFPWLIIVGGQAPVALVWALATRKSIAEEWALEPAKVRPPLPTVEIPPAAAPAGEQPDIPDYELLQPPFGRGSYGKVWLARNAIGQWQALKVVYLANFGNDSDPYEREFNGIKKYKPVSDQHPGLLRVDFVSKKKDAGYFYYVMELGDPLDPGWEREPSTYRPRDLVSERRRSRGQKLPARECLRIGIALAEALDFLHRQGLTHRDIKPQNIIFVNGQPKLADVGLIAEIRPPDRVGTLVGTPGYMPPPPEPPGTPQADIYALGMVLYVLCTGRGPDYFPEISTTLADGRDLADFLPLNKVLTKACHPDRAERYASAADMCQALRETQHSLDAVAAGKPPEGDR